MIQQDEDYDNLYRIVIVGDSGVGKSHIHSKCINGSLPDNPQPTVVVELATRIFHLNSGYIVKANIFDLAGARSYRKITTGFIGRAVGALLVYDVTNKKTFSHAKRWIKDLREFAEPTVVIMLVGNKIDICDRDPDSRQVSVKKATRFAKANQLLFEETSSFTATRVDESFETLVEAIYEKSPFKKIIRLTGPPVLEESSSITDETEKDSDEASVQTKFATKEDVPSLQREIERLDKEQNIRMIDIENLTNGLRQKEEENKALIDQLRLKEEECKLKDQEIIDLKDKYKKLDEESKFKYEVILNSPISI